MRSCEVDMDVVGVMAAYLPVVRKRVQAILNIL